MIYLHKKAILFFSSLLLVNLTGCATFEHIKPAPPQSQAITLKISPEELSAWSDLPIGAYRIPDSQVIISGHQQGAGAGLLFGLIGLAVAHAANVNAGADSVKDIESQLRVNLNEQVKTSIQQIVASNQFNKRFTQTDIAGNSKLFITPALVLSYLSETDIRPFVVLKVNLVGMDNQTIWTTRYFASAGDARPLTGTNGWLENGGAAFKDVVQSNLDLAMRTMVADIVKPFPRDEKDLTMIQANFPYMRQRLQTVVLKLNEDDRYLTTAPRFGDLMVFSGVNIFDKSTITYRPATPDDSVFKIIDNPTAQN